jgi:hypothetical protein
VEEERAVKAVPDERVQDFERELDRALDARPTVRLGGTSALLLAANIVETAYAVRPISGRRLAEGLQILAPALVSRTPGDNIDVETVFADLEFAAHYHVLRDLLYYSYNALGAIKWIFDGSRIEIRFADSSLPRQFYLAANNWMLTSISAFADEKPTARIEELLRGTPEFEPTDAGVQAQALILEEVDLKLGIYFNLVPVVSVGAGGYTFDDFLSVYRALLVKALYHRYHARINGSRGVISMPLDELSHDLESSVDGVSSQTARQVVSDISFGVESQRSRLDPVYFSLYRSHDDEILMLPHHFAIWEGIVNFLRLVALRDPPLFLRSFSQQIGEALVQRLAKAFSDAGFTARTNVPLRSFRTNLPDIDILVISAEPTLGYVVLVCEVKSPLPPRWAKDQLRVLEADSIAKAFDQLTRIIEFLDSDDGVQFLTDQLPRLGLPDFDEFAVALTTIVATSDNAGAFFSGRGTVIDFRTLERLLSRCDGDMRYILEVLKDFPEWADNGLERVMVDVQVGDTAVSYEEVAIRHLMDFRQATYRSAGEPERMVREMREAGGRPSDVLRERGFKFDA